LEDAAIRETYEETGFQVALLPLPVATLATSNTTGVSSGAEPTHVTEPIAVTQRVTDGRLKIIFWFAAQGDSTAVPEVGTQQPGEDSEPVWASWDSAIASLSFNDDRQVAREVVSAGLKVRR